MSCRGRHRRRRRTCRGSADADKSATSRNDVRRRRTHDDDDDDDDDGGTQEDVATPAVFDKMNCFSPTCVRRLRCRQSGHCRPGRGRVVTASTSRRSTASARPYVLPRAEETLAAKTLKHSNPATTTGSRLLRRTKQQRCRCNWQNHKRILVEWRMKNAKRRIKFICNIPSIGFVDERIFSGSSANSYFFVGTQNEFNFRTVL